MSHPRSVLVTGANRGIGQAIAQRFLQAGDKVATITRSGKADDGVLALAGDVSDATAVNEAFSAIEEQHGPVEVLVANAGITRDQLILRMKDEDFDAVVDVNLKGTFRTVKRAIKPMIRARAGRIILIGSVVGMYGTPGQVNYASSKAGLIGMARSLTRELGARGITSNVIAPGFIDTDMTAELPAERQAEYRSAIPLARFGAVEEVAGAAYFLAGPDAAYISGAVIPVDGGIGMGH